MKKWTVRKTDGELVKNLTSGSDINEFMAKLLVARGIVSTSAAADFFGETPISDPYDIADMDKAVDVIGAAVTDGDKILVYGDYDCDGVTSTAMLYSYLEAIGAEVVWRIPTRAEGYGLNAAAVDAAAADGVRLIITVDNGISSVDEAEYIYEKGMKLVITDHHQVPSVLPRAEAIVNPHRRDDTSQYKQFAGCGVVLKLIMAMENDIDGVCEQYSLPAAIGTIGDIVPLTGENRTIVSRGLDMAPYSENQGLNALFKVCGIDADELSSTNVSFTVCPRINAAGRYGDPKIAAELLLSDDAPLADSRAERLCEMNTGRQNAEKEIMAQVMRELRENPALLNRRVLVVKGEGWNSGIIGIISARLLSKYGKPCIVLSVDGDTARGSARSTGELSLFDMLDSLKELLVRFGGHIKAAGLTIETEKIEELKRRIYEYSERLPAYPIDTLCADMEITAREMTLENIELLERMQPFGEQNPVPVFLLRCCVIKSVKPLKEGKYVSFGFSYQGLELRALSFNMSFAEFGYPVGASVDIMANIEINEYNERKSLCVRVRDIRLSGIAQDKFFAALQTYETLKNGGTVEPRLLARIIPQLGDMKKAYDILKKSPGLEIAAETALASGINYCMFRVIIDVLEEFGLAEHDVSEGTVRLVPSESKADLTKSVCLNKLRRLCGQGSVI